jgi:hypothetical protein
MTRIFRPFMVAAVVGLLAISSLGTALANATPPTEGGNGAGSSGQCTGDAHDRPNSCQSPNGAGE